MIFNNIFKKFNKKKEKKKSIIKELISNPDEFIYQAKVEEGQIVITINKKGGKINE